MNNLITVENGAIVVAQEYLNGYAEFLRFKAEWELKEKQFKKELQKAMEENNVKSFENDVMKVTYVAPTSKTTFDSKRFKEECPDLFDAFTKTSTVSASVRVSVK